VNNNIINCGISNAILVSSGNSQVAAFQDSSNGGFRMNAGYPIGWCTSTNLNTNIDLGLWRDTAGTLAIRGSGNNFNTSSAIRVYNYISASALAPTIPVHYARISYRGNQIIWEKSGSADFIVTTSLPVINAQQEWSSSATTFTGIKSNITDTASSTSSLLLDLQVNSTSSFNVNKSGSISVNHIIGNGITPVITSDVGAGTGGTCNITGSDTAGVIVINAGTLPSVSSVIATITFNTSFGRAPYPVLWPSNANAATLGFLPYVSSTTSSFTVNAGTIALGGSTQYRYNYACLG
jgi:hypothetical protein